MSPCSIASTNLRIGIQTAAALATSHTEPRFDDSLVARFDSTEAGVGNDVVDIDAACESDMETAAVLQDASAAGLDSAADLEVELDSNIEAALDTEPVQASPSVSSEKLHPAAGLCSEYRNPPRTCRDSLVCLSTSDSLLYSSSDHNLYYRDESLNSHSKSEALHSYGSAPSPKIAAASPLREI